MSVEHITATPERLARAAEWTDAYMRQFAADGNDDGKCAALRRRIDALPFVTRLSVMQVAIVDAYLTPPTTLEDCDALVAAQRSWYSCTEQERHSFMADHLGVSFDAMEKWSERVAAELIDGVPEVAPLVECCLYRHFDADGQLLYVGISDSPETRAAQHGARSDWFFLVADTTEEWYESRAFAEVAERKAITSGRPLFNKTHNKRSRDLAVSYLTRRLAEQGVLS